MELGIGTAQFGLDYGITNKGGVVSASEQNKIIDILFKNKLRYIDTAPGYGTAEQSLGKLLKPYHQQVRLITKGVFVEDNNLNNQISTSLKKLECEQVYAFLIHDYHKLSKSQLESLSLQLKKIKESGLSVKVGASLYGVDELKTFLEYEIGDIIQIPMNPLDWRFLDSEEIKFAKAKGIEVHSRSLFLQGTLLAAKNSLPEHLSSLQAAVNGFISWSESKNISPLEACWAFARSQKSVDVSIIGVEGSAQFLQSLQAYNKSSNDLTIDSFKNFRFNGELIDPRNWAPA